MPSGFFALIDDIGALMDDVAVSSKVAASKTAGILGDDLAVSAEKATGFLASRELPVLWAITKGSLLNKLLIVPVALVLNIFLPAAIPIILLIGGFYLAYEGVENILHWFVKHQPTSHPVQNGDEAIKEKARVKGAITTDLILSVEIVIIALGTVLDQSLSIQIVTVSVIAVAATIGVYGIVALIVRMDDAGAALIRRSGNKGFFAVMGRLLVKALPIIIRVLSIVGTIALILVAGNIFLHQLPLMHHWWPNGLAVLKEILAGVGGGAIAFLLIKIFKRMINFI